MRGKRILVTGGAGCIGSNVANHLARDNEVIALDDTSLGVPDHLHRDVTFVEADVRERGLPTDVDHVIHLAALSSYGMHEEDPARGVSVNVAGFVNVIEQARVAGCDSIVYASTSSMYESGTAPSAESDPIEINTAYEASKRAREVYSDYFRNHYGVDLAGMRLFSVYHGYGADESLTGGFANVIAQFVDDLAHGRRPEIYGDGTQTRDFIHVDDVVRAIVSVADAGLDGIYNLGSGQELNFNELVDRLNGIMGTDIEPRYVSNPIPSAFYASSMRADASKLRSKVGWEPRIDLDTGLRQVCGYYVEA